MSLMAALAIVGALVLAAVIAHGAWSARKASPRRAEGPVDGPRVEPTLHQQHANDPGIVLDPGALPELKPPPRRASARLDPLIDAIAPITLEAPVSGELALTHLPPSRRAGTKPFLIEGLNAETGDWELPASGQRYGEFQAGVQMANRSGGLNQIEFSEFVQKLQGFADGVGGMVEVPDMIDVVNRARELDAFAGEHDAQLAVTLRANGAAWSVGYVQQCAGRRGFVPGVLPGRLVLPSAEDGAPPLLVLGFDAQAALAEDPNIAAVREVTLSLDVLQTPEVAEPFPAWHDAARTLAADMDAAMVDDQGRTITLHAFAAIGEDLKILYRKLEARDLAAGSTAARRLFS
ncbi:cell division protein FtsZ [Aquincola sp. S2]|uniref:Cell division protein FtsZ n=1 Tax=Pseudaquabacterium terrae TaxID=2732868 RepID=A0ABX2EJB5_9BURK|nr:cell division protein FtsZ [Aquabacterium terrae]NRF68742.1 cell division protein FtsZ [Aquabacterium terrae]